MNRPTRIISIIHSCSLFTTVIGYLCALTGVNDSLPIIVIIMVMCSRICVEYDYTVEFTIIGLVLVNVMSFVLNDIFVQALHYVINNVFIIKALSPFMITEILGWALVLASVPFHFREIADDEREAYWNKHLGYLIFAFTFVILLRILVEIVFKSPLFEGVTVQMMLSKFVSNAMVWIILVGGNFFFIYNFQKYEFDSRSLSIWIFATFMVILSFLVALMAVYRLPFHFTRDVSVRDFLQLFVVTYLLEIFLYALIYMIWFSANSRRQIREELGKTHQAQFGYMKFKQLVNPHFLFNSLNVLDGLVQEGDKDRSSDFIRKLAGMYRYLTMHESEDIVTLKDESYFVKMYADLMMTRFPAGLKINFNVNDQDLSRYVVTCTLQLLIENAVKHNTVSADKPLVIDVTSDGEFIKVVNNVIPKVSLSKGTGLGQEYIKNQYHDLAGEEVFIREDEQNYCVEVPLL